MPDDNTNNFKDRLAIVETNVNIIKEWSDSVSKEIEFKFTSITNDMRDNDQRLHAKIEELSKSKQITAPLILSFAGVLLTIITLMGIFHEKSLEPIISNQEKHGTLAAHESAAGNIEIVMERSLTNQKNILTLVKDNMSVRDRVSVVEEAIRWIKSEQKAQNNDAK